MPITSSAYPTLQAPKPHGGFILLTVQQLCLLWWLYRIRSIHLRDLRVWYACHEMVARRCQLASGQVPTYTYAELHSLVGGRSETSVRASLRRLTQFGLLTWSPTVLTFATTLHELRGIDDLTDFLAMLAKLAPQAPSRRVPVPRQTIRLLAAGVRPAVLATMLGHLLRDVYYHPSAPPAARCRSGGWCKASWIADVFHLHRKNIKTARRYLASLGWLLVFPTPQRLCNRWGLYTQVSLTWERATIAARVVDTPPSQTAPAAAPASQHIEERSHVESPLPVTTAPVLPPPLQPLQHRLPPPLLHEEPFQESQHQEPFAEATSPHPSAISLPQPTSSEPLVFGIDEPAHRTDLLTPSPSFPTLQHIVPEDLQNLDRLLMLFQQAHEQGRIGRSLSDRLTFVALAEHALVLGTRNPCGLFAALVQRQLWHYVTQRDEEAARRRLQVYDYGPPSRDPVCVPPPPAPPLSQDAFIVQGLQRDVARSGFRGDLFPLLHAWDAAWTRPRWDAAVEELGRYQQTWQATNTLTRLQALQQREVPLAPWEETDEEAERWAQTG